RRGRFDGITDPASRRVRATLVRDLRSLSRAMDSMRALRQIAILQHALSDGEWRDTLRRLSTSPRYASWIEAQRELASWHEALEAEPVGTLEAARVDARIRAMDLGWFGHLASESLYR